MSWALAGRCSCDAGHATPTAFRAELVVPPDIAVASVTAGALALSPDGRRLAFVAAGDRWSLAVRDLGSGETSRLAGSDGARFPFWSPDVRWLAFFAEGKLKKVEAAGGPVQVVCDAHAGRGGSWSKDGTIVRRRVLRELDFPGGNNDNSWTNLRAVADPQSANGWKLEPGPFKAGRSSER